MYFKFTIPKSNRQVSVKVDKYLINWDKPARSKLQTSVKQFLRPYFINHIVAEELRIPRTRLTVDLVNFSKRIAIEVQGRQHEEYVEFFHRNVSNFYGQFARDAQKEAFLLYNGYTLIQIMTEDVPLLTKDYFQKTFGISL